jgi:CubicO group peptidase (beta-lactamase class C family)
MPPLKVLFHSCGKGIMVPDAIKSLIMNKHIGLSCFILFVIIFNIKAQESTSINPAFTENIPTWMSANNVRAVGIGIIENGKLKYIQVLGEVRKYVPAPQNTIFNIGSLTNTVVAIVTLKLVESGQWSLDEPLGKYWVNPELTNDPLLNKLTTRLVLSQQYSEEGYGYLRSALETKLHKSFAQLSDSILFKPLGMINTSFTLKDSIKYIRVANGHDDKGNLYNDQERHNPKAAACLLTTVEDYSKFLIYIMKGAGLSIESYLEMVRPQVKVKEHIARGLGWTVVSDLPNFEYALEQEGGSPGFKAMTIIQPKSKRAIVVFTNGDKGNLVYDYIITESTEWGQRTSDLINGTSSATIIHLNKKVLGTYAGTYELSGNKESRINITKEGSEFSISGEGMPTGKLLIRAENKFFIEGYSYQYEFVSDENNTQTILNITDKGKLILSAKKIK